jgi:hypothetical protein
VKFSDAKTSSFAELKVGDQLRALGERSAEGTRFTAEQVVSGTFRTVGGTVKSVSPETNEIKIEILGSKQPLTIITNSDSTLRRIPPQIAVFIAQQSLGAGAGGPSVQMQAPAGPGQAAAAPRPAPQPGQNAPGGMTPGDRPRMEGGGDFQDMLERMPALTLADLKPGDVIAVSSTLGTDPSRLTAITLVTGVDVILTAMQRAGARRTPNLSTGLPAGVLDLGIAQP